MSKNLSIQNELVIAKFIEEQRNRAGMSQVAMADIMGISNHAYRYRLTHEGFSEGESILALSHFGYDLFLQKKVEEPIKLSVESSSAPKEGWRAKVAEKNAKTKKP
jgi:hypothetical protein